MRQTLITVIAFIACNSIFSQTETKNVFNKFYKNHLQTNVEKKDLQLFAEVNPQFFAFGGFGAGAGIEFSRIQTGFIYLHTKLTPKFRDAIFNNAEYLDVPKNTAAEIFANVFLRKDRKGLYAGTIISYDGFSVTDTLSKKKEEITKTYVVLRAGFRWFPFQDYFYIDGGYGISFNVDKPENRTLGASTYSPKPVLGLPFFAIGGRFYLQKQSNKKLSKLNEHQNL